MKIGCVVMAAGNAARFGENKLHHTVEGKSLILRALEAVPAQQVSPVVVVTQYPEIAELAKEYSFTPIINAHPEWGQSHSLKLGLRAVENCDAVLFQVADQPLLRRETVEQLLDLYLHSPASIAALSHDGVKGNPCIFPARFFDELLALEGDCGGRAVRRNHEEDVITLEVAKEELWDVDTQESLKQIIK